MLTSDQIAIIDVAASGFNDVWADQILMEGELSDRIGAEYLASVSIAKRLADTWPERVRVEVPFKDRLDVPLRRNAQCPFPSKHAAGRVDVVLFSDNGRIVPQALVELKRTWVKQPILCDAERIADYLMSRVQTGGPQLFGFCLFPITGRHSVTSLSAATSLAARERTVKACLPTLKSKYPQLDFEAHLSPNGATEKLSWEEHEGKRGLKAAATRPVRSAADGAASSRA